MSPSPLEDESAEKIIESYLPLEYRKFYEGLPEQISMTPSPTRQQQTMWKENNDNLQSPANTVSTVASSVVSSLTPPFVMMMDGEPHHPRPIMGTPTRGLRTALRASLLRECELRHDSLVSSSSSTIGKLRSRQSIRVRRTRRYCLTLLSTCDGFFFRGEQRSITALPLAT